MPSSRHEDNASGSTPRLQIAMRLSRIGKWVSVVDRNSQSAGSQHFK
jgi:hypothetical protein